MFINGAMFIVFAKCSKSYVYSRGYAYPRVKSMQTSKVAMKPKKYLIAPSSGYF